MAIGMKHNIAIDDPRRVSNASYIPRRNAIIGSGSLQDIHGAKGRRGLTDTTVREQDKAFTSMYRALDAGTIRPVIYWRRCARNTIL